MGNVRDRRERVSVYQFLLGSRGEWGYIRPVIEELQKRGRTYEICATNMAVLPEYGNIAKKIRDEGYVVTDMPLMALAGDSRFAMAKSLGVLIQSFVDVLARNKPKWLVLAGDRGEQLAGAIAGSYTYVPTAHIQAGELSGNIDGVARHAIARFAHVHFASNRDASSRLHRFGEQEERIFEVGAPQLDDIANKRYSSRQELALLPDLKPLGPFLLVINHANTDEWDQAESQARELIAALARFRLPKVVILPNNDAGSNAVRQVVVEERTAEWRLVDNLSRPHFLGLMASAEAIVGNSSSGLLEAPSFGLPAVNIGNRQGKRVQAANVINCSYDADEIENALKIATSPGFRNGLRGMLNPYGDGNSSRKIVDALDEIETWPSLRVKNVTS